MDAFFFPPPLLLLLLLLLALDAFSPPSLPSASVVALARARINTKLLRLLLLVLLSDTAGAETQETEEGTAAGDSIGGLGTKAAVVSRRASVPVLLVTWWWDWVMGGNGNVNLCVCVLGWMMGWMDRLGVPTVRIQNRAGGSPRPTDLEFDSIVWRGGQKPAQRTRGDVQALRYPRLDERTYTSRRPQRPNSAALRTPRPAPALRRRSPPCFVLCLWFDRLGSVGLGHWEIRGPSPCGCVVLLAVGCALVWCLCHK